MTTKAEIMLGLDKLSQEDQEKLLAYLGTLPSAAEPTGPLKSARGLFANRGVHITREIIDEARKEEWANFPREFPPGANQ